MGVKQWVCQLSLDCSCLPKEAHSSRTAWLCEANALKAKKDSTGSSKNLKKKKKGKTCVWDLLVADTREIKIEVNDLKFSFVFA